MFIYLRVEIGQVVGFRKGRKKKAKGYEERVVRSSLLILDLKDGKL